MNTFCRQITAACVLLFVGCQPAPTSHPSFVVPETTVPIKDLLDQTLESNQRHRTLSSELHGAWQVLHGILAYGKEFKLTTPEGEVPAVEYLLQGNYIPGFQPRAGAAFGERPGLKVYLEPREKVGQGHRDQWLAVLSQCGLSDSAIIRSGDHEFTLRDWVNQIEWDTPPTIDEAEYSWTLIALAAHNDTDRTWQASDGNQYNMESLLKVESSQQLESSACGGTHRLIGISMAIAKRQQESKPLTENWQLAQQVIDQQIQQAKASQNPDGSYSAKYMHRPGWTRDLGQSLGSTGHVLEFLAIASDDETIASEWVERTARKVCEILKQCEDVDLECGSLYHALHGLMEYRSRLESLSQPK